jgi:restriction endonuclease Mrr
VTIPTYRDVDLALLVELVRRREPVRPSEVYADVARHFPDLTPEDLAKTRQDGRTKVFVNMVHWARDHLRVRGLLADPARGLWQVNSSATGAVLEDLRQRQASPEQAQAFIDGRGSLADLLGSRWAKPVRHEVGEGIGETPRREERERAREEVAAGPSTDRAAAKRALLDRLNQMEGYEFEQFVGRLLDSLGFRDTQVMGRSGDEGMDVLTYLPSPLVTATVAVQVKRHAANIGPRDISYLRDRWAHRADKLLFITTSDYTLGAREVAADSREKQVELVNGEELVEVMVNHRCGVRAQPVLAYELDEDYFSNL